MSISMFCSDHCRRYLIRVRVRVRIRVRVRVRIRARVRVRVRVRVSVSVRVRVRDWVSCSPGSRRRWKGGGSCGRCWTR